MNLNRRQFNLGLLTAAGARIAWVCASCVRARERPAP
jgi:hypothetical protein